MASDVKIARALISVTDKTGVVDFARVLSEEFGVEIISTGGTAKAIEDAGIAVTPIEDFTGNLVLQFLDHSLDAPTYSVDECRDRDATYARPLKVKVCLITKEGGEIKEVKEQEIFMGDFPTMTEKGTFVINGAERVIVSQLVRSPGIYYQDHIDQNTGRKTWSAVIIPNRGAWLEFETDTSDVINVRIDKARKVPATVLIRALGFESDDEIRNLFDSDAMLEPTLEKDTLKTTEEALFGNGSTVAL